jgi:hypothetical protein
MYYSVKGRMARRRLYGISDRQGGWFWHLHRHPVSADVLTAGTFITRHWCICGFNSWFLRLLNQGYLLEGSARLWPEDL